jgi:hypothetical protein
MTKIPLTSAALLAISVTASAQTWKIPLRGVAFYERTTTLNGARPRRLDGQLPGLRTPVMPAVLLQGELDRRNKFVQRAPAALQDLAAWLAFDIRKWSKKARFKKTIEFLYPYGRLQIAGTTSAVDADGTQVMRARITRKPPERGREFKGVFNRYTLLNSRTNMVAEIEIERRFDEPKGVVTYFKSTLSGTTQSLAVGESRVGPKKKFSWSEAWTFERVAENRYRGFTTEVKKAIVAGSENIRKAIANPDGKALGPEMKNGRTAKSGRLALALLTLLKADVDPSDEVVKRGFDSLRRRVITGAYECSAALMAMEALYANPNERQLLLEGRIDKPLPRKPTPEDLEIMREWTKNVLSYFDTRIPNRAYVLRFNYTPGVGRYDNSVTQYCVLGLYSAHLCGVEISPTVWFAISKHVLMDQYETDSPKMALRLTSQRKFEKQRKAAQSGGRRTTTTAAASRRIVAPSGWAYLGPVKGSRNLTHPLTGSMTVAGLTNLTICEAALRSAKKGGFEVYKELRQARFRGFAWMLQNFSVRDNPNFRSHYFYYMYGLERAAELAQVALIGERDWYFEGATMLIRMQKKNGAFAGLVDNCFAVLFLKQAAPPLPTFSGR